MNVSIWVFCPSGFFFAGWFSRRQAELIFSHFLTESIYHPDSSRIHCRVLLLEGSGFRGMLMTEYVSIAVAPMDTPLKSSRTTDALKSMLSAFTHQH
jgi:hypothetical protein